MLAITTTLGLSLVLMHFVWSLEELRSIVKVYSTRYTSGVLLGCGSGKCTIISAFFVSSRHNHDTQNFSSQTERW